MTTEGKGAAAPRPPMLSEAEEQKLRDKVQQALLDTFALVHQVNAENARLKAENAMLVAALALLEKGRAA